jgi:hypothetical protein
MTEIPVNPRRPSDALELGKGAGPTVHDDRCECKRCAGFGPRNEAAVRHGAYATVHLAPRAQEIADAIVHELEAEGLWRPMFGPAISIAAVTLVRVERAEAALQAAEDALAKQGAGPVEAYLGNHGANPMQRLREDSRRWANAARGYLNDLGLTPRALAAIARDTGLARATRSAAALQTLGEHLEREHGTEEEG